MVAVLTLFSLRVKLSSGSENGNDVVSVAASIVRSTSLARHLLVRSSITVKVAGPVLDAPWLRKPTVIGHTN